MTPIRLPAPAIDHLVYGVPDLDTGSDAIERLLGARPVPGGRHPKWGTHNALLGLGPACYLEVIAADPDLRTPEHGIGFGLAGLDAPRLVTWALRPLAIDAAAAAADLGPVHEGRRERPDGSTLSWRLSDPRVDRMEGVLPFLIAWDDAGHPATTVPHGGDLVDLRLQHPSPADVRAVLDRLLDGAPSQSLNITVESGAAGLRASIRTRGGLVELG